MLPAGDPGGCCGRNGALQSQGAQAEGKAEAENRLKRHGKEIRNTEVDTRLGADDVATT